LERTSYQLVGSVLKSTPTRRFSKLCQSQKKQQVDAIHMRARPHKAIKRGKLSA